jgi:hypothetical protein
MDTILGRTKRQYRESRTELGAIKKRHAELVADLNAFVVSLSREPLGVYVQSGAAKGLMQSAMDFPGACYFYSPALADRLNSDAVRNHLDEYRRAFERVESLRKSLVDQGDDDPGPALGYLD